MEIGAELSALRLAQGAGLVLPQVGEEANLEEAVDVGQEEVDVKDLRPLLLIRVKALSLRSHEEKIQ